MPARRRPWSHSGSPALPGFAQRSALQLLRGLCIVCVLPAIASAQGSTGVTPPARSRYDTHIAEAAKRFGLPPSWIRAVLDAESAGEVRATSRKGAMGLMQIVPETWSYLRVRYHLGGDPYDPRDNIVAGSAYIRELLDRYGTPGWIAAYNAGPGRYEMWLKGRRLPAETRAYVAAVAFAIVNGGATKSVSRAMSPRLGWKHAPLFFEQRNGSATAYFMQQERLRDNTSSSVAKREPPNVRPQSIGLFVPRTNVRSAP